MHYNNIEISTATLELLKEKGYRIQKNGFDTICNL